MRAMIHILYKPATLLLLLALVYGNAVSAQDHTHRRNVRKQFSVTRETTLEIQNKYGKIQMATWDRDSVVVEVDITLTESNASKLRKLRDDISIDFTGTNNYIIAKTVIKSESGRIASEIKSVTHTISGTNKQVEINYMVHLPVYMDVVLQNKFGDIYMDDLTGQLDIELSNGVLKANNLTGNSTISLSFANGMVSTLGSCTMKLSYSDLGLGEVNQLDLVSKSSKLNVEKVNVLKIDSRRDKLYFQHVEYFYGNSSFTQVWIYDFLRESDIYMKYGEMTMEHVMPGFTKIYVVSEYTDVTLFFDRKASLAFDILHHEKSVVRLPGSEVITEDSFDGKSHYKTTGTLGEGEQAGEVRIDALEKCFINISYK